MSLCGYFSSKSSSVLSTKQWLIKMYVYHVCVLTQSAWVFKCLQHSFSAKCAQITGMQDGLCIFVVCPNSCSLATPRSPIPLVNKGWETVLLKTSSIVPRKQKVAFPVYYLYKFVFIHPVEAHHSQVLKRERLTCFLLPPLLAVESNPSLILVLIGPSCLPTHPFLSLLADSAHWPCSSIFFFFSWLPHHGSIRSA